MDEAHEYFDKSISDMLEQARKANIGLVLAHQSISQSRGGKGGSNIADTLMVNTATKLIWTSFREDAAKFAGSMQVKPEDILNLPQFTFGMHSRKQGFLPIKGTPQALSDFGKRSDTDAMQSAMEARYGPSEEIANDPSGYPQEDRDPADDEHKEETKEREGLGEPPEVETI